MGDTLTSFDALLKEYYCKKEIIDLTYGKSSLYSMIPKHENATGSSYDVPVLYGAGAGGSATFSDAQTGASNSTYGVQANAKFQITPVREYQLARWDRLLSHSTKSKEGAFMDVATSRIDSKLEAAAEAISIQLYGSGDGVRGTISSYSSEVITLTDAADAKHFTYGMGIELWDASANGFDANGPFYVTAVDREAGTITIHTAAAAATASGDSIIRMGDADDGGSALSGLVITGLGEWLPTTAPTTSLFGLDRTVDTDWLGGVRYAAGGKTRLAGLLQGINKVHNVGGGAPTHVFMGMDDYTQLRTEMITQARPATFEASAKVKFTGVEIDGPSGPVKVFPDRFCPDNTAYILTLKDWELVSWGGPAVQLFDNGKDQAVLRVSDSDDFEVRIGGFNQLSCRAPGRSGVVTWT